MTNKAYKIEREKISKFAKELISEGTITPIGGQISLRISNDTLIVKASGQSMLDPDDYCIIEGKNVPHNISKMFPVHKYIFAHRKENLILHVRLVYVDILASLIKGKKLVSPEILWGLRSEIPVEAFPNKKMNNFNDLINIFIKLAKLHLVDGNKTCFVVKHFGTWLLASDLDNAYTMLKILESAAKIEIYKIILGVRPNIPANLRKLLGNR